MLQPVLRATSNIRSPLPPAQYKPNITSLQHQNSTSATLKFSVCNTQQHCTFFETFAWDTCKLMFATSKKLYLILKHSHGTLATSQEHRYNMCTTICKHKNDYIMKTNDCNMSRITSATFNIRNIGKQHPQHEIFFCNIKMKHFRHSFVTSRTSKTYSCNIHQYQFAARPQRRPRAPRGAGS
jgi:hypothetical protein